VSNSFLAFGGMLLGCLPVLVVSCVAVALLQTYLTRERVKNLLGSGGARGYLVAVALGIVTPFSAASGLPLAAGLLESGVPLGLITTFLVICPFVSPVPVLTVAADLGWEGGAIYLGGVIGLGVLTGLLFDRLGLERRLPPLPEVHAEPAASGSELAMGVAQRTWRMMQRVAPYLVVGMILATLAYLFLPGEALARYVGDGSWWALPVAMLLGVPVLNLVPVLFPVSLVLVEKGVALGVVLSFSMSAASLKLPESLFLARLLGVRVLAYLLAVVVSGVLGAGALATLAG